jgi:hypothetical protein
VLFKEEEETTVLKFFKKQDGKTCCKPSERMHIKGPQQYISQWTIPYCKKEEERRTEK